MQTKIISAIIAVAASVLVSVLALGTSQVISGVSPGELSPTVMKIFTPWVNGGQTIIITSTSPILVNHLQVYFPEFGVVGVSIPPIGCSVSIPKDGDVLKAMERTTSTACGGMVDVHGPLGSSLVMPVADLVTINFAQISPEKSLPVIIGVISTPDAKVSIEVK
jgi:hypothetical protein